MSPPYGNPDARYGRVQDDGTVKPYPSERAAEKAGPCEAIVIWSPDSGEWIYPATGRAFKPSDVAGLSPATASADVWRVLDQAHLSRSLPRSNGVISRVVGVTGDNMRSEIHVQKTRVRADWSELAQQALSGLSRVVRVFPEHEGPEWNYFFLVVLRRRS